jgi:hypothetical protein
MKNEQMHRNRSEKKPFGKRDKKRQAERNMYERQEDIKGKNKRKETTVQPRKRQTKKQKER